MTGTIEHDPTQDDQEALARKANTLQDAIVGLLNEKGETHQVMLLGISAACASLCSVMANPYRALGSIFRAATDVLDNIPSVQEHETALQAALKYAVGHDEATGAE